jgi:hypothetical protein
MRENESGMRALVPKQGPGSAGSEDPLDDEYDAPILSEHQAAHTEWMQYCSLVKHSTVSVVNVITRNYTRYEGKSHCLVPWEAITMTRTMTD